MNNALKELSNHFCNSKPIEELEEKEKQTVCQNLNRHYKNNYSSKKLNHYHRFFTDLDLIRKKTKKVLFTINESINFELETENSQKEIIQFLVEQLKPWHKGIYKLGGLKIDGQWNCNFKWQRIAPILEKYFYYHNKNLQILDIGCGNGYFLWQIINLLEQLSQKPNSNFILGVDRHLLYMLQFYLFFSVAHQNNKIHVPNFLPINDSQFFSLFRSNQASQENLNIKFDVILSMGVLYHQKNPIFHLEQIKKNLKNHNSILILETLISNDLNNPKPAVLVPKDKYCKMKNVWFIPNLVMLKLWLKRLKFNSIEVVDISQTTNQEQRATNLSQNWGSKDAINHQTQKTIEGYESPVRVILKIGIVE